jgi:hypothetical protein
MKRIVIDSMIVDLIMETPGLLESIRMAADRGALVIITTHIQVDQLAAAQGAEWREKLLATYDALSNETIPTRGFVLGISRLDHARLGDGEESDVSLEMVKTGGRGGLHDALIAMTASRDADVLVTEDENLMKKARAAGVNCEIWTFQQFVAFVQAEIREG